MRMGKKEEDCKGRGRLRRGGRRTEDRRNRSEERRKR